MFGRNSDILGADPRRMGNDIGGERLQVVDGLVGGIDQEGADEVESFIVGDMCSWLLMPRFAVGVLERSVREYLAHPRYTYMSNACLDDCRCHSSPNGQGCYGHRDLAGDASSFMLRLLSSVRKDREEARSHHEPIRSYRDASGVDEVSVTRCTIAGLVI
jgi:hypothetical protein